MQMGTNREAAKLPRKAEPESFEAIYRANVASLTAFLARRCPEPQTVADELAHRIDDQRDGRASDCSELVPDSGREHLDMTDFEDHLWSYLADEHNADNLKAFPATACRKDTPASA